MADTDYASDGVSYNRSLIDAQIGVSITLPNGQTFQLSDFTRLSVTRNANYNVLNSVGKHNRGYIKLPRAYSFTVSMWVTTKDAQLFRMLYDDEVVFTLEYYDVKNGVTLTPSTNEFKLNKEKLNDCILTTFNDSYEVEGMPTIVFNGLALTNQFVATIDGDYGKIYGTNEEAVTQAELSGHVESEYWTIT